ncbi:MAG: rRNA cytosine-C5-methyltransferase [Bacteroidales bacterium]|nr:rRNA cytosine-C5-methyltransferase [Bacteroidales bacterium]
MTINPLFIQQLGALLPPDECKALADAIIGSQPEVSVRVNARRGAVVPAGVQRVPWCAEGFYVPGQRPQFTFDTDFQSGLYYVQDASSMFISHVLRSLSGAAPLRYLDLCAAPGGKTTAAMSALPEGSLVVANEIVPLRARVLRDNVARWGSAHCLVSCNAPQAFTGLTHFFDVVAADVPCSGEGMMRKDATAAEQWTPQLVEQCAARQRTIIDDVWPALRPGGLLIYSTCTYNRQENELMVDYIADRYGAESVAVPVEPGWGIRQGIGTSHHCYRFMPHLTRGEGLFMCVLRKPSGEPLHPLKPQKQRGGKQQAKPAAVPAEARRWLDTPGDFAFATAPDGTVVASPSSRQAELATLRQHLNLIHSGTAVGTVKGRKFTPSHELALSQHLASGAFPEVEVDYPTAIAYLRGESLGAIGGSRGYCLLTHRGQPLGFVNNLGTRANNLLPKTLRIISHAMPAAEPAVLHSPL